MEGSGQTIKGRHLSLERCRLCEIFLRKAFLPEKNINAAAPSALKAP